MLQGVSTYENGFIDPGITCIRVATISFVPKKTSKEPRHRNSRGPRDFFKDLQSHQLFAYFRVRRVTRKDSVLIIGIVGTFVAYEAHRIT